MMFSKATPPQKKKIARFARRVTQNPEICLGGFKIFACDAIRLGGFVIFMKFTNSA